MGTKSKKKNDPTIKVYEDTLNLVRKAVSKDSRMTIVRFYDEAALLKLEMDKKESGILAKQILKAIKLKYNLDK